MKASLLLGGEDTGTFDNVFGSSLTPRDVGRVTLSEDFDGVSVDDELAVLDLNGSVEATVGRLADVKQEAERKNFRAVSIFVLLCLKSNTDVVFEHVPKEGEVSNERDVTAERPGSNS